MLKVKGHQSISILSQGIFFCGGKGFYRIHAGGLAGSKGQSIKFCTSTSFPLINFQNAGGLLNGASSYCYQKHLQVCSSSQDLLHLKSTDLLLNIDETENIFLVQYCVKCKLVLFRRRDTVIRLQNHHLTDDDIGSHRMGVINLSI